MSSKVALRALEQQVEPGLVDRMQRRRDIGDHRLDLLRVSHRPAQDFVIIDGVGAKILGEHEIVVIEVFPSTFLQNVRDRKGHRRARHAARPCPP